ncbi:MAG: GatB/YqeY domain-containing protein [Magnetospiraceae bacterium]
MLRESLSAALKEAVKAKQERRVSTLRLILAALKDRDIMARGQGNEIGIDESEILSMLQSMIKQRRESIAMYEKGCRMELAEQEADEIAIIEDFLPKQLDDAEIEAAVKAALEEAGASTIKDMGKVMGLLRERHAGCMDFSKAGAKVKQALA